MVSITLAVSKELKDEMNKFPEINWSAVARKAIINKIELLKKMNKLLAESELTEEDAVRFGKAVSKKLMKKTS